MRLPRLPWTRASRPLEPGGFAARAAAGVRQRLPGVPVVVSGLRLRVGDAALDLGNAYRRYLEAPEALEAVLAQVADLATTGLEQPEGAPEAERFHDLAPYLLPRVQSERWLAEAGEGDAAPAAGWLANGLVVCYVVDRPETAYVTYLTVGEAARLGVSLIELHEAAAANLAMRSDALRVRFEQREGRTALVELAAEDDFAASRILLGTILRNLADPFRGPILAGLPHRDRLLLIDGSRPDLAAETAARVAAEFSASPHGLSPRLFELREQELVAWGEAAT